MNTGELFYLRGSHRLEEFLYADRYKSVSEAMRGGVPAEEVNTQIGPAHSRSLVLGPQLPGWIAKPFLARRGDVLIWHADLAHGGGPISAERTRRSVVTHYCSKYTVPLFPSSGAFLYDHHGKDSTPPLTILIFDTEIK